MPLKATNLWGFSQYFTKDTALLIGAMGNGLLAAIAAQTGLPGMASVVLSTISVVCLNTFIYRGTEQLKERTQSLQVSIIKNIEDLKETEDTLSSVEEELGSFNCAVGLLKTAQAMSIVTGSLPALTGAGLYIFHDHSDLTLLQVALPIAIAEGFTSLAGFVVFNIIGTRTTALQKKLDLLAVPKTTQVVSPLASLPIFASTGERKNPTHEETPDAIDVAQAT